MVQEAFARVWRARSGGEVRAPKTFLFTTARNLALDVCRHRQALEIECLTENDELDVMEGNIGVPETVSRTQELELLTLAIQSLPDRCRQVLTLRKIYGQSQREIARQLDISEHTVEVHVANGVKRCAEYLARHGLP